MTTTAKIIGILIIIAAMMTVAGAIYKSGMKHEQQATDRKNSKAGDKADSAAFDYDDCRRAGRVWNYVTDKCGWIAPVRGR